MASLMKKTVEDIEVRGKRVIVRVDFNVPQDKQGNITDDKRIRGALPTILNLSDRGARVILVSHLGRPKGGPEPKYSMKPASERLAALLGRPVAQAADVIGEDAKSRAAALQDGDILMLENVRFHKEETKNSPAFARELASMADIFVNDAFGTAHRAHASTAGLANFLPAVAGFLIRKELDVMGQALDHPARPFVAILGGAKVSDKIGVIENLLDKVDTLIIGGGMAYTFLKAKGCSIGKSICEDDKLDLAKALLEKAEARGVSLLLPYETVIADRFAADAERQVVSSCRMPDDWMGLDIGPESIKVFSGAISKAATIVWNGPMGVFEFERFADGTREIARAVADSGAVSIIGGGDSAAALEILGFADRVTHISTGGGASLEYLEGKVLPGIDCLMDKGPRRPFVAGNWKMNKGTPAEAVKLAAALLPRVSGVRSEVAVAVPATALAAVVEACAYTNLKVAAQNVHFESKGAFTGEISPSMLAEMGIPLVVVGHSERRQYFGETDETVNRKVKAALDWGLRPIVCVGETLAQREAGETLAVVRSQVEKALAGVPTGRMARIVLAYEPVWAIGTGRVATEAQAQEVCALVRGIVRELHGDDVAEGLQIQYGGSVTADNAAGLFAQPDIDGGLVGGASLKEDDFTAIVLAAG